MFSGSENHREKVIEFFIQQLPLRLNPSELIGAECTRDQPTEKPRVRFACRCGSVERGSFRFQPRAKAQGNFY
jgi:hypothetical protein